MGQERIVKVVLTAQMQNYLAGMEKASKATRETADEAQKLAKTREDFERLGRGLVTAGGLMAAGLGVAVVKFSEFDAAMSNVQAATGETASGMEQLGDAALAAGSRTVFSATEAAYAIEELGKAGVSTSDILSGGLDASLDLAAAGGLEVADAAGIAAVALKTFNLEGEDMGHVADLLAAGAGKAMGEVSDLSAALNQSGQVAASTGLTIDETTAALAAFASQGLLGSDAGTSFKTMLGALTPNSAKAAEEMKRLGISAYDASGNFVGLDKFAGNLQDAMRDLTPQARSAAMEVIFGSDAVRAANVLYSEGEAGIRKWTSAVDDQGYAARTAATKLDNLKGDIEALGGAIDTGLIQTGSFANDTLRGLVQAVTGMVDVFNDAPEPIQATAVAVGATAAAMGLAGGAAILAIPKLAEFKAAMATTGLSMKSLTLTTGLAGAAITGLGFIVAGLAQEQATARAKAESYASSLAEGTLKVTKATRDLVKENLAAKRSFLWIELDSAYDAAEKLGISLDLVTDAAMGNVGAMKQLRTELEAANDGSFDLGNAYATVGEAVKGESASLDEAIRVAQQKNRIDKESVDSTNANEDALRELAGQAQSTTVDIDDLAGAIREFGSASLDTRAAQRAFEQSLDDLTASLEANGATLDINTQEGRNNQAAIDDLAQSTLEYAGALVEQTGDQEAASAAVADGRQKLIDMLGQFGITGQAAEDYADDLGLIPENVNTAVSLTGIEQAEAALNQLARERYATIRATVGGQGGIAPRQGLDRAYANGGAIYGPGTATSDNIPILASPGEHELTVDDVVLAGEAAEKWELVGSMA